MHTKAYFFVSTYPNGLRKPKSLARGLIKKYLGGRGLGAKIYYDEIGPEVQPLSQEIN